MTNDVKLTDLSDEQLESLCWKLFKQVESADKMFRAAQLAWEKRQAEKAKSI